MTIRQGDYGLNGNQRNSPLGQTLVIDTPEQLRVLADPFRQRLMQVFAEPSTVRQAAEKLQEPVTKLYHHVDLLLKAGFLHVVSEQRRRATTEKTYRVSAHRVEVSSSALGTAGGAGAGRESLIRAAMEDLAASASPEKGAIRIMRVSGRLPAGAVDELARILANFVSESDQVGQPTVDLTVVAAKRRSRT